MPLQNELQRLHHLDALLRRSTPGNASDLAERLGVSRRTLFRYFEQLSDWGAEIAFCRRRNRYGYHRQPVLPALPPPLPLNEIFFQKNRTVPNFGTVPAYFCHVACG